MNYNQGSLSFTSLAGTIGALINAFNGVSKVTDPGTGDNYVVLGNDEGDTPAELVSNREIPMRDFLLRLLQSDIELPTLLLSAGNIIGLTMLANEGSITTRIQVNTIQGSWDFDPINENFHHFIGFGGIE